MGRPAGSQYNTLAFIDGSGRGLPLATIDEFVTQVLKILQRLARLPDKVALPHFKKYAGSAMDPRSAAATKRFLEQRCILIGWCATHNDGVHLYYFTSTKQLLHVQREQGARMGGGVTKVELGNAILGRGSPSFEAELKAMHDVLKSGHLERAADGLSPFETDPLLHVLVTVEEQLNDIRKERLNAVAALDGAIAPVTAWRSRYRTLFSPFYDS